jgi:ANTAR domain-containing protein/GAF domain-containing protein
VDVYEKTLARLGSDSTEPRDFAASLVEVLPISGASVATVAGVLGSETVSASDDLAARLDELQFDFAEGPCWDVVASGAPVLTPALSRMRSTWPNFAPAAEESGIASIFAFPLRVGPLPLGAIDLFSRTPLELSRSDRARAAGMSDVIGRRVLRHALEAQAPGSEKVGPHSRRVIHQATGVVLAQLDVSPDDAALILQTHAYSAGRSIKDLARAVVAGEVRFERRPTGIEVVG